MKIAPEEGVTTDLVPSSDIRRSWIRIAGRREIAIAEPQSDVDV